MPNLKAITALGGTDPRVDTVAQATLSEVTTLALASVTARLGQEAACQSALTTCLNITLPDAGSATLSDPFSAVWMGPDQWMIGADFGTYEHLADYILNDLAGIASVTEQTDAWAGFDLAGEGLDRVMELLCPINMRAFPAGTATRSTIHHLGCFVISGGPNFIRILGPRASAGSLHHAILTAMHAAL